jgi:hypothetical protein
MRWLKMGCWACVLSAGVPGCFVPVPVPAPAVPAGAMPLVKQNVHLDQEAAEPVPLTKEDEVKRRAFAERQRTIELRKQKRGARRTMQALEAMATDPPPLFSGSTGGSVHVRGYSRRDGTYVQPHTRSAPRR